MDRYMSDLVSVIIPTFNRESVIHRAIQSVLNQTYKNIEIIVVDDGSSNEITKNLIEKIDNKSIKYFYQKNSGVAHARNSGARIASGMWLSFLDSDDEWLPEKLSRQMEFLKNNVHFQIAYTDEIWKRNNDIVTRKKFQQKVHGQIFEDCVKQCLIAPSSVILHQKLFWEMKGFDESFVVCEDYDLWLRISSQYEIALISEPLIIKHGGHVDQLSTKYFAMDMWRLKAMHGLLMSHSDLPENSKKLLLNRMKEKGFILIKGYEKYQNIEAVKAVQAILKDSE
jgi:cellulose synthase/poly-beta-1,6-N-acetylglucosamine synthase-like glycosyltransferase